ncbi:MAG: RHS repeat-associated core domain-containing protein, partial [Planctomycetota bacterium]
MNYIIDYLTNRYSKVGDANITYDQAGNLALDKDGYEYEYDYENRIVKITKDGNDIAGFAYDALGRRIEKKDLVTSANTRRYYHGGRWQVLVEYDGAGTWKDLFVYGNYIDEVLISGQGYVYAHDHLYSPVALLQSGSTGAVLERYEYDAYGSCHVLEYDYTDDPDGKSDYGNPYLFTGRRVDTLDNGSLTIQYNRNRYYDYYTGRWTTHDPKGYIDGMNLCDYVVGNP